MPETDPLRPGDPPSLGSYRLVGRLGEGGQGSVYLGLTTAGENVAVKVLHARFAGDVKARARFASELANAKRVAPFCTAPILDADVDGDIPYLVSEFIDGPSLFEVVTSQGPRTGTALDRLAIGTITALTAIHEAGIVHRDFKPGNVIIAADGPRVIDFGIARALDATGTLSSTTVGTPSYMSPEQISGAVVGAATDVWAWGVTIIYAATGRPAFGQDSIPAVMHRILNGQPDFGLLIGPLRAIVVGCLAKDPAARPSAQQVLLRLLGLAGAVVGPGPAGALGRGAEVAAAGSPPSLQPPAVQPPAVQPPSYHPAYGPQATPGGTMPSVHAPSPYYPRTEDQIVGHRSPPPAPAPRRRRRGLVAVAAGAAGVLVIALGAFAVEHFSGQHHTPAPVAAKGSFRLAMYSPGGIDPSNALYTSDFEVVEQLFTGLTSVNADGTLERRLAERYLEDQNCTHWQFQIKSGTAFSNGEKVDAESFARSWNRTVQNKNSTESTLMEGIVGYGAVQTGTSSSMSGVTASGDTLNVQLSAPDCAFDRRVSSDVFAPMPSTAGTATNTTYNDAPIGNGPYKLQSYVKGQQIVLVRNESYGFAKPALAKLTFSLTNNTGEEMSGFDNGQYDWAELYSYPQTLSTAQKNHSSDGSFIHKATDGMDYMVPITNKGPMSSPQARQAVSYALDRKGLSQSVYQGWQQPATSIVPPAVGGSPENTVCSSCLAQDQAKAKNLAQQAHLPPGSTVTLTYQNTFLQTSTATAISSQLKSVLGWNVQSVSTPSASYYTDLASGKASGLYLLDWGADYPAPDSFLATLLSSASIGQLGDGSITGSNYSRYKSPTFDGLLGQAESTSDPGQRAQKMLAAEQTALNDMALIPLFTITTYRLANVKAFKGLGIDLNGFPTLDTTSVR